MSSPGGSQYREYRRPSRTPSGDRNRRMSQGHQHGGRRGSSTGRKTDGNYRVNSLAVEEPVHTNDEYNRVFTTNKMYPNCPDFSFPN